MSYIGNTSTTQAFTPVVDFASGNGSTTAYTLSRPVASVAQVQVTVANVPQNPTSAYTISGQTLTFTSAPPSGTNNIYVYYTSPITQVIAPGQGTVTATSMASSTGTGAGVFQTSPTITTPTINQITSAASTNLTLQSAGTTAVTIDTSQNVGIGTSSPTTQLSVYKGGQGNNLNVRSRAHFGGTTSSDSLVLGYSVKADTGATDQMVGTETNSGGGAPAAILMNSGVIQFHTASSVTSGAAFSSERMRIDSSGNLLVGATTTSGLQTATAGGLATDGKNYLWITRSGGGGSTVDIGRTSSAGTGNYIEWWYQGTNTGTVSTNGSTTSYNTSSDYRLKENIAPMTGALATVAQLKPCTYKWKVDGSDGQGFIAHELQEVVPDCVTGTKDEVDADGNPKYQGIDTSFLVATLTAAIQELSAINDALTARIEALENK